MRTMIIAVVALATLAGCLGDAAPVDPANSETTEPSAYGTVVEENGTVTFTMEGKDGVSVDGACVQARCAGHTDPLMAPVGFDKLPSVNGDVTLEWEGGPEQLNVKFRLADDAGGEPVLEVVGPSPITFTLDDLPPAKYLVYGLPETAVGPTRTTVVWTTVLTLPAPEA